MVKNKSYKIASNMKVIAIVIITILLVIIIVSIIIRLINTYNVKKHDNYKLHQDGVCVIKNIISKNTIMDFKKK